MKRLLSVALALSLIGGTAAYAGPHGPGGHGGYHGGYHGYHGGYHGHDDGAAIAAGFGALALIAILASQDRHDYPPPPPPPPPPENAYPQDNQGSQDYQGDQQGPQDYQGGQDDPNYGDDGDQQ